VATIVESPAVPDVVDRTGFAVFFRLWSLVARARKPLASSVEDGEVDLPFPARVRKFLWLSSGLFSVASLMMPAIGFLVFGSAPGASANFLAAIVSACLFGIASLLHFGPDEA